jgi:heme/copper-type cytochrome/quinol oxidase subunit 2
MAKRKKAKKRTREEKEKRSERLEALMRIVVLIISGAILIVWRVFVYVFIIINLIYTLITGRRMKYLAELSEVWNTQWYFFQRYIIFESNIRPFPFSDLARSLDHFQK